MKKIFALLLTTIMCATIVTPASAAVSVEKTAKAPVVEAAAVSPTDTVEADNGAVSGEIPGKTNPSIYKLNLSVGGRLSLKGSSTQRMNCVIMDEREEKIVDFYNWSNGNFDKSYELTQGTYFIKIYNDSDSASGTFKLRTYFDTEGKTTFPENSNDTIYKASSISLGQKVLGHTAANNSDDYYKIVIPGDGKYIFTYRTRTESGRYKPYLYDSSLNEVKKDSLSDAASLTWEVKKGTYYFRISNSASGFYDMIVTCDTHSYSTTKVTPATLKNNGSITKKCSGCGKTTKTTIYRPTSINLTKKTYTYDGKAKKPGVVVTNAKGFTIGSSSYTVSYDKDATSVGKHKVKINFKGKYSGSTVKTYTIKPKSTSISKLSKVKKGFKVTVKKQSAKTATGYQVQYSLNSKFKSAKDKTIKGTSLTVKGLKKNTVYYVRVRTYKKSEGKTYYSSWSAAKSVRTK